VFNFNLEDVDKDGAIREAAENLSGDTRFDFLRKAGIGTGAVLSGGAILGAFASSASAAGAPPSSFGKGAIGILNFALTLEYLESTFYTEGHAKLYGKLSAQGKNFVTTTKRDEAAHVAFLKAGLGKAAVKKPSFDFGAAVSDEATFLATAYVLENTGVHAYLGQAPNLLSTPSYLVDAASIVTVEARHAGAIATILGKEIAPNGPFDNGETAAVILKAVTATKFIK
jgi:hypothetical protein